MQRHHDALATRLNNETQGLPIIRLKLLENFQILAR